MKLSDFDFELPAELIAQTPADPRDHARLLVYDRSSRGITDDYFYNLKNHLHPDTALVINNSKVEQCRLQFDEAEIFVLKTINPQTVLAMVRPGRKFRVGKELVLHAGKNKVHVRTTGIDEDGFRTIELSPGLDDPAIQSIQRTPFPPYISPDEKLADEYQTVYAKPLGSKAAPTAGLHFTTELLADLEKRHNIARLTLHVGLGTFAPVKTEDITEHKMHSESIILNKQNADVLNHSTHLTAVGTTSARALESIYTDEGFYPQEKDTEIFITPGYRYNAVDSLITNFHLPKSTLLMMVGALTGTDELHRIYQHAIANQYRFYSFGDAMIIR